MALIPRWFGLKAFHFKAKQALDGLGWDDLLMTTMGPKTTASWAGEITLDAVSHHLEQSFNDEEDPAYNGEDVEQAEQRARDLRWGGGGRAPGVLLWVVGHRKTSTQSRVSKPHFSSLLAFPQKNFVFWDEFSHLSQRQPP